MRRALTLARRYEGMTSPNPPVGAVVVLRGEVVGEGSHRGAGYPHGEAEALEAAGNRNEGADLYVTLEPCSHHGRTPPCTEAILKSGVTRVFIGTHDPNPDVMGGGAKILEKGGVSVSFVEPGGRLGRDIGVLYESYKKFVVEKWPFVVLKAAMTLDGKIATSTGDSKWITSERARRFVHGLRKRYDAVLVGIGTVKEDDPELTVRLTKGRNPTKVVIDPKLEIDPGANIFSKGGAPVFVAAVEGADKEKIKRLEGVGATVIQIKKGDVGIDLDRLLGELAKNKVMSLLVEGGAKVFTYFIKYGKFDKIIFIYSPRILTGSDSVGLTAGVGPGKIADAVGLEDVSVRRIGEDIAVIGYRGYRRGVKGGI